MAEKGVRSFCVDGTNVVRGYGYAGPAFRDQEDADAQRLIAALAQLCEALGERIEVEVIFDGAFRPWRSPAANLRVRFAQEVQADDLILDRVRSRGFQGGGRVTVVTGDSDLGRKASEEGARWQRVYPGAALESVLRSIESRFA